ncbi:MAG: amidohydrolase family protein [Candidatus Bathyarchaeia archaeon]|nr:amidohydrolase [Candidatus Bathyarchaeota archaeon]
MIIDAHAHLGYDYVFEEDFILENLVSKIKQNKVDISIVQPGTVLDLKGVIKQHNAIAKLSKKMSGKILGMANPNPHLPTEIYCRELRRCIKDLRFVGVKLHPLAHAVNPKGVNGKKVFESALDLGVPVMVHTGTGGPWALPSTLISVAMEFPKLKIILAHSGGQLYSDEAALAAKLCPNIYLETSWIPSITLLSFGKNIGVNRIMFGSDHPENIPSELAKYRTVGFTDEELKWCLAKTAAKVFNIATTE